jgi:hypothetical protein
MWDPVTAAAETPLFNPPVDNDRVPDPAVTTAEMNDELVVVLEYVSTLESNVTDRTHTLNACPAVFADTIT